MIFTWLQYFAVGAGVTTAVLLIFYMVLFLCAAVWPKMHRTRVAGWAVLFVLLLAFLGKGIVESTPTQVDKRGETTTNSNYGAVTKETPDE